MSVEFLHSIGADPRDGKHIAQASRLIVDACDTLYEAGELRYDFCRHGLHFLRDHRCRICIGAVVAVATEPGKRRDRQRLWSALCSRGRMGATREELARLAGSPEKTACWAVSDWVGLGQAEETSEQRTTRAGRMADVVRAVRVL
jgi:hypothetical protein